jgi:hypothetical protein
LNALRWIERVKYVSQTFQQASAGNFVFQKHNAPPLPDLFSAAARGEGGNESAISDRGCSFS